MSLSLLNRCAPRLAGRRAGLARGRRVRRRSRADNFIATGALGGVKRARRDMPALDSAALQARRARRFLLESLFVIARERSDEAIQTKLLKAFVWIASLPLAYVQVHNFVDRASNWKEAQDRRPRLQQHSSGPVLKKKARAAPARDQHQLKRSSVIHRFAWRSVFHR
jgi:hypothetical protein